MKRRMSAGMMILILLLSVTVQGTADFVSAGNMMSPAVLGLIPQNTLTDRFWAESSRYTWSYASLFFKPEERKTSGKQGPDATDPEDDDWDDQDLLDDDSELWGIWASIASLTDRRFYVEESVEGITSSVITLSNGREVEVSEHSSPVSLYLLPEKGAQ